MQSRPKYLNLLQIRLPVPALASILHRISGALLFFALPLILFWLQQSLASQEGFEALDVSRAHWLLKIVVTVLLWALFHHLCAGIRHLVMDVCHRATELQAARSSAVLAIGVGIAMALVTGIKLW